MGIDIRAYLNNTDWRGLSSIKQPPPPPPVVKEQTSSLTLKEIAFKIIGENNNISRTDIIQRLQSIYRIDEVRAINGFEKMREQNIIKEIHHSFVRDYFYITNSIPF